jgi:hypothetical protein
MPSPPSTIHLYSPALASKPATRHYIVYFIPGNPGLIGYYHIFLTHLYSLLTTSSTSIPGKTSLGSGLDSEPEAQSHIPTQSPGNVSYEIFGRSLSGFETDGKGQWDKSAPYNVEQQIEQSEQALRNVVYAAKANGKRDVRVILMGHSLGTYICLELMRRLREEATRAVQTNGVADGNDEGEGKGKGKGKETVQVVGGALLFATVIELAKSPSGVKFKVRIPPETSKSYKRIHMFKHSTNTPTASPRHPLLPHNHPPPRQIPNPLPPDIRTNLAHPTLHGLPQGRRTRHSFVCEIAPRRLPSFVSRASLPLFESHCAYLVLRIWRYTVIIHHAD